jgi:hypothetical protein
MTVSNQSLSLLESVLSAQTTRQDVGVAVMQKSLDTMKMEGAAAVRLMETASVPTPVTDGGTLDAYA